MTDDMVSRGAELAASGKYSPSASSASPVRPVHMDPPARPDRTALDEVRTWFGRFIRTVEPADLDLLTLWSAHTHLVMETYTTPRLLVGSPVPGSGKTTCLEHLGKFSVNPVQVASISSPALLPRLLVNDMRTILIDEADRALDPKKEGVTDMLGILNSGYKRGGTRPVLVPAKGGTWDVDEMTTYAPVAMAGNNPDLPEDTKSRCIRVLLLPDFDGTAEESDWELLDEDADALGDRLAAWAETVRDQVRTNRPTLPEEVKGRGRERWSPLLRVAEAAGGRWPEVVRDLAKRDMERIKNEREEGLAVQKPHVTLLHHIHDVWGEGETFIATDDLLARLIARYPQSWGTASGFGKDLTPQRMGRMLVNSYNIHSHRESDGDRRRGYLLSSVKPAFAGFGLEVSPVTGRTGHPDEPDGFGDR